LSDPNETPTLRLWMTVWSALILGALAYVWLAPQVMASRGPSAALPGLRPILVAVATLAALIGSWLVSAAARHAGDLASPQRFQARSVAGMALIESVAVLGFVATLLGDPPGRLWWWSACSVALLVGVALPAGLAYWREWAMASGSDRQRSE
jgi:hypothetical protein